MEQGRGRSNARAWPEITMASLVSASLAWTRCSSPGASRGRPRQERGDAGRFGPGGQLELKQVGYPPLKLPRAGPQSSGRRPSKNQLS